VETKNQSSTNQARNKANSNFISISFFSKFVNAKVDKKRPIEDTRVLVEAIDLDKDGYIGANDLEAFVGRASFHQFFEKAKTPTHHH
jgi:Ca2+-binding EF-hand superfamily protein